MKQSVSTPVAIGIVVLVVLVAAFFGWRYMNGANRDKNGLDLNQPSHQPANMGQIMQERMNSAKQGRAGGPSAPAAPGAGR